MSMSYTALVQTFTPQRNPLCRPFEVDRVLHRCFRSDILPDRADNPRFHDADIFGGLYLTTRTWKDRIEPPQTDHPHESLLDMLFWDDTFPRKPLCILGMVGAGKSTLIDYYLRCYCPTRGSRQADFEKKLVLHFDARTIRDNTDFYHRFFLFLQSEMRTRCLERGLRPRRRRPPPADATAERPPVGPRRARGADACAAEDDGLASLMALFKQRFSADPRTAGVGLGGGESGLAEGTRPASRAKPERGTNTCRLPIWWVFADLLCRGVTEVRNARQANCSLVLMISS